MNITHGAVSRVWLPMGCWDEGLGSSLVGCWLEVCLSSVTGGLLHRQLPYGPLRGERESASKAEQKPQSSYSPAVEVTGLR